MLLGKLYTIKSHGVIGDTTTFSLLINADHPLYTGHFPGSPITPGVVLCEMVKELLGEKLGHELKMHTMRQCKFLLAHNPVRVPELEIEMKSKEEEDAYLVQAVGKSSEDVFFKLSASYLLA